MLLGVFFSTWANKKGKSKFDLTIAEFSPNCQFYRHVAYKVQENDSSARKRIGCQTRTDISEESRKQMN